MTYEELRPALQKLPGPLSCTVVAVSYAPPYPGPGPVGHPHPDWASRPHRMSEAAAVLLEAGLEAALEGAGLRVDGMVRLEAPGTGAGPRADVEVLAGRIAREVKAAARAGRLPIVLGDCSATVGAVAGLAQAVGPLGAAAPTGAAAPARRPGLGPGSEGDVALIWLDAHADFNTPETSPSGYLGGMPLAVIAGRGNEWWRGAAGGGLPLPEGRITLAGVREMDPGERDALAASAVGVHRASAFRDPALRPAALRDVAARVRSAGGLFFHVDVDVLDPSVFAGVTFPTPGGLAPDDLFELARLGRSVRTAEERASGFEPHRPVALDISAFDPPADEAEAMSQARKLVGWVARLASLLAGPP